MRNFSWLLPALWLPVLAAGPAPQRQGLPPDHEETVDRTGPTDAAGFLRGRVTAVDPATGRVALESGGQPVTLNGKPDDLSSLVPGREVSLPFENYGGHLWVTPVEGPTPPPASRTVEGRVTSIDKNEGRVAVDGTPYLAHPDDLAPLAPGSQVRLGIADVGGRSWVVSAARR
jgi:hypothetical protein